MNLVIDAQVVCAYFNEVVLEVEHSLTEKTLEVFTRLGDDDRVFLDEGQQIEHEWRSVVEPEWFDAWYPTLLATGAAFVVPVDTCVDLRRALQKLGFPQGKDFWYIRTAKAVAKTFDTAIIVTEDMDFFEPKSKVTQPERRQTILLNSGGSVCKHLRRKEQIEVHCVRGYLENRCRH